MFRQKAGYRRDHFPGGIIRILQKLFRPGNLLRPDFFPGAWLGFDGANCSGFPRFVRAFGFRCFIVVFNQHTDVSSRPGHGNRSWWKTRGSSFTSVHGKKSLAENPSTPKTDFKAFPNRGFTSGEKSVPAWNRRLPPCYLICPSEERCPASMSPPTNLNRVLAPQDACSETQACFGGLRGPTPPP
jgi:hypothetical protein